MKWSHLKWTHGLLVAFLLIAIGASLQEEPTHADVAETLRGTTVYPPQELAVKMNHELPAHASLRCERCHVGATDSTLASDRLLPTEASCAPCHDAQTQRPGGECSFCHLGEPRASRVPTARLHFSHETHAQTGVPCLSCHQVQRTELATRQHLPTMQSCFRCHGGDGVGRQVPGASSECSTCHLQQGGVLRTEFGEARMLPPAWLFNMEHDRDFLVRHRWVAADNGEMCTECHHENECADCHDGRTRPPSVHPNDFLTVHGPMARRDDTRCASCHTVQRFCAECHARLGLSPMAAPIAAPAGGFHPPGWIENPSGHAMEARRSMNTCTSCHAERDCVVCHGASGVGGGVSPHGPSFAPRCESLRSSNPRACQTCHGGAVPQCP
ncbi:MAG: hypothetical protein AB8H86_23365 [Polyangiales bacterium]